MPKTTRTSMTPKYHTVSHKRTLLARGIAALLVGSSLLAPQAIAANGTWLGTSGDWSDPLIWNGGTIADGADFTANFTGVDILAAQTINLDAARTIGNITFTDVTASHNLTISGANPLTLDVTAGAPVLNVTNQTLTISSTVDGLDGLTKSGAGTLVLSGNNNITGPLTSTAGALTLSGTNTFNGTVAVNAGTLTLSNIGALGTPTAITLAGTLVANVTGITVAAPITLNANSTISFGMSTAAVGNITYSGPISGNGNLTLNTPNVSSGANLQTINLGAANTYTGNTTITIPNVNNSMLVRAGAVNTLPVTTSLNINGGNGTGTGRTITYDLNGFDQTLAGLINTTGLYRRTQRIHNSSATPVTLTVNNGVANTFSGRIGNGGTNLALTKGGVGTLTLGGDNDYTGATVVNGGALALDFSQTASGSTVTPSNYIDAASTLTLGGVPLSVKGRANGIAVAAGSWTATAATNVARLTLTSPTASGLSVGQIVTGTGIPAATFIVAINGNVLILNNNVSATSGSDLAIAATNFTTSQTFASTTLNAGASNLSINTNGGDGTVMVLNAITRNAAATVNFTQPTGTISATNGYTTTNANTDGILGAWATVGGTGWASSDGTNIVALSTYTLTSVAGTVAANYTNNNIDVDNSAGLLDGPITPNTLRFNSAAANTVTLAAGTSTINTGGLLVSSNVGNNLSTITGGSLQGASGAELIVSQHNTANGLTIASTIVDNTSATGLTKSGAGLLTLTGTNAYTGPTTLGEGTLSVGVTDNLGAAAANLVFAGGTLQVTGTTLTNFSGIGHTVSFNPEKTVGLDIANSLHTFTVDQVLNQAGGGFTKLGAGTVNLNQTNTYTGPTTVSAGTLVLGHATNTLADTGAVTVDGATSILSLGTNSDTVGVVSLRNGASITGSTGVLTGASYAVESGSISANFSGAGAMNKTTAGSVTLTGTNITHSGAVNVTDGTLNFAAASIYSPAVTTGTLTVNGANAVVNIDGTYNVPNGNGNAYFIVQNGGVLNFSGTGTITNGTTSAGVRIGEATAGTMNMTAGSLTYTANTGANFVVGRTAGGNGTLNVSGGTLTATGAGGFLMGSDANTTGTVNVSGTGTLAVSTAIFRIGGNAAATAFALNLNPGGTLLLGTSPSTLGGTSTFNFDGGTLKASANITIPAVFTAANIKNGGAIFDTNSNTITVNQDLLNFSGATTDTLTKNGAGTLILGGANTYTGTTTISAGTLQVVTGGTVGTGAVANNATFDVARTGLTTAAISGTGTTTVTTASATLTAKSIRQAVLSIGATSQATLTPSLGNKPAGISVFTNTAGTSLSIATGGNFDVNDNDLIVYYQAGQGAATLATIQQQIIDGFLGTPAVAKISTSTGAVDMDKFLVAIDNGGLGLTAWEGVTLTGTDQIIVKYTLFGDLNLDNTVDSFDYSVIDSNFGSGNSWLTGDSNLDGMVDSFDYSTVDTHFGKSFPMMGGGAAAGLSIAAVPEPSTLVLGGLAVLGLAGYRLRRHRAAK